MGILDVKELTAGTVKFSVNIEHTSGMVIKANGGLTVLLSA